MARIVNEQNRTLPELRSIRISADAAPTVAGLRVTYREAGERYHPSLVLLHGIGSTSKGFRHQFAALGDILHVVAWDAPGYGDSSDLRSEAPAAADYADALLAVLDRLTIRRCHLLGSSLGAIIAAAFAARRPERVSTLVLSSPALGHAQLSDAERATKLQARLDDMNRPDSPARAERRARALCAQGATDDIIATAREQLASINRPGYGAAARMLSRADILADTARIDRATLIVSGREDRITPVESCAARIQASIPGAMLEIIEDAGHLVHLERPKSFNSRVRHFLRASAGRVPS